MKTHSLILCGLLALPLGAAQASYPDKPIRLVVGFATGGSADLNARMTATELSRLLGQPVVVENRAGASGTIAVQHVANSAPDGYTLLFHSSGTHVITPHIMKMQVDPLKDLEPVAKIGEIGLVIVSNADKGQRSLEGMIREVKAKPGVYAYGSPGIATTHHLAMEMFNQTAGLSMIHAGYKGSAPGLQDLAAGTIPYMIDTISTAKPLIDSGRIVPLALTSRAESALLPGVKTLAQLGKGDIDAGLWLGISAPRDTPPELVSKLNKAVNDVLDNTSLRERLAATGWTNGGGSAAEFKTAIVEESDRWKTVIERAGIKID